MCRAIPSISGKKPGFSLVETLLALVLLAVAVFSLALVPIATTKLFVHTATTRKLLFWQQPFWRE